MLKSQKLAFQDEEIMFVKDINFQPSWTSKIAFQLF
jgi:hypothetical protein